MMQAEEKEQVTESEEISWVAWSQSSTSTYNWFAQNTGKYITHADYTVVLSNDPDRAVPAFFCNLQTMYGGDTATIRYKELTNDDATIFIEEEGSNDSEVSHTNEEIGYIALWGDAIGIDDLGDGQPVDPLDFSEIHFIEPFPIENSYFFMMTNRYRFNLLDNFDDFQQQLFLQDPATGYCGAMSFSMEDVSNQKNCEGGTTSDVGYYYRVVFPNTYDDSTWCFKLPVDFDLGGVSMIDGKWQESASGDLWKNGDSTALDFCTTVTKGMHLLEVMGSSTCCDEHAPWKFQVDGGEWLLMTSENMDIYMQEPQI